MSERFYLAGKVSKNCWRHSIVRDLRGAEILADAEFYNSYILKNAIFGVFDYVGPYFICCDHGCCHRKGHHGRHNGCENDRSGRSLAFSLCMQQIRRCDILFAWINSHDCYGTIAEIGYAHALGKKIYIALDRKRDEMWFCKSMASDAPLIAPSALDAFQQMFETKPPKPA